jgi:tetratricopeptide (TPR) repeat protein
VTDGFPALSRARSLIQVSRYDAALDALVPALGDPATDGEAWCLRTQALLAMNDLTQALPAARKAVSLDPGGEWPHRLLALVLQRGGNHKDALRSAQEAARIAPYQAETLHVLAICQANARRKADSEKTVHALLERHPHTALSHQTAGSVAAIRGKWSAAEGHLREALRLEPNDADVASALADVLQRLGRREEAGEALLAAARADPTNHSIRRSLGRLGLPVVAFGGFGLFKVMASVQALRVFRYLYPATAVILCAVFLLLVGGYLSYARVSGTRHLPEHIHRGLMADHRNYVLGWLAGAACAAMPLAVWAAAAPPDKGQSWPLAVGLAVFSAGALGLVVWLWTGPFPTLFPSTPAWLERRRNSRRA